ncbi:MAG: redoxin domain-containing protein [Elusimicrobia bacterium]|nr:redoxin domain-containing protein [Elusimicrobiota bacterium]
MEIKSAVKKYGIVTIFVLAAIIGISIGLVQRRNSQSLTGETSGRITDRSTSAPDFTVYDLANKPVKLADFKGKAVVLDFWATWCPPCLEDIPHFKKLHQKYSDQGLVILGVSLDESGRDHVKEFVKENSISYPIAMSNDRIVKDFGGIRGIPTTFIIDRNGKTVEKLVGYHDLEKFESLVKKVL